MSDKIQGVMYDDNGQRTFTDNVDLLTIEMSDKLIISTYRNTRLQKALFIEAERFHNKGLDFKVTGGFDFEPELIENALTSMATEILERFGEEYVKTLEDIIINQDLAFLKNRPEELK